MTNEPWSWTSEDLHFKKERLRMTIINGTEFILAAPRKDSMHFDIWALETNWPMF